MKKTATDYEIIFGIHPIRELLKAKRRKLLRIYTTKPAPKAWDEIVQLLPKGIQIQYVNREALEKLAGTSDHQGILAFVQPYIFQKKFFSPEPTPFLLMLDGIQDPRNLGALLRSAYCTGVNGVIITQKRSAPLSGIAHKASAGLAEHLSIYQAPSAKAAIIELKKAGYQIYLSLLDKADDVRLIKFKKPLCLVIGSEGTGISRDILHEGIPVFLPQRRADISYNASVAGGIFMFIIAQEIGALP